MKKIIIIASVILVCIIIILSIVLGRKSPVNTSSNSPFPTGIPSFPSSTFQPQDQTSNFQNPTSDFLIDISTITPVETEDFKLQYSPKLNKIVVERKTPQADEQFINWASQNQLTQLIENPELTLMVELGKNPDDANPLLEFLNIFMNFGQGASSTNNNQSPNLPISQSPFPTSNLQPQDQTSNVQNQTSNSLTYFAQCNGYGDLLLPSGCNLCQAGCGPTTVAMIAASYLGSSYNPKTIVDTYRSNGYLLGCVGSRYSDAKQVLQNLGLKTTDYLMFNAEKSDTVVPDLRKYLNTGWTFFALTRFCDDPKKDYCGHFFWITDIDNQGNIFAYDPYYGRYEIPYNENSRYPYPLYRLAFGVKR